jgi:hypothetical protein
MKAIILGWAACILALLLAPTMPVLAQGAVLCGCYCGITISPPCSEEACKAACGYSEGGSGRGGESGPAQVYYCRAVAPSGAWGWASSSRESWARQNALAGCRKHADGCQIEACRINDPSLAQAPPAGARPPAAPQGPATPDTGWCGQCVRKLQTDIDGKWASGLIRAHVGQAIAGYENCKQQKAGGMCAAGDQMVARLRACGSKMFDAYRSCLTEATELAVDHSSGRQQPAYDCSVCDDGLERNVAVHIGNPRMLATYVDQAVAYYENCTQRAGGSCSPGDRLAQILRGCNRDRREGPYHACVKMAIDQRQQQR